MTKDKDGKVHPYALQIEYRSALDLTCTPRARWEFQGKHKDGSLRVDIPLRAFFFWSLDLSLPLFIH